MRRPTPIAHWPLILKVPLLVAGLMVGIAALISQIVFSRLVADQESNLRLLTGAYLDGLSAALLQPVLRADVWESFDALDRAQNHYSGVDSRFVIVELPNGKILAASDPIRFPADSVLPEGLIEHFSLPDGLIIDGSGGRAWLSRMLRTEGFSIGRILSEIDISELLRVRRNVTLTLLLANAGLTAAFALFGYFASKRMLQPLGTLTNYVERARDGVVEPIPVGSRVAASMEFRQLFDRFNAMAHALNERTTLAVQLADQEKYAVLGKLASGMAHEVNNPLGGLFNALDTLRRHGDDPGVRESTINLLQRGLVHIRNVVGAALVTYRRDAMSRTIRPEDIEDLRLLIESEIGGRNIVLDWDNQVRESLPLAAGGVRQATLNVLLNACAATPPGGRVGLHAAASEDALEIEISDEGAGLPESLADFLRGETDATLPPSDSLGLWIVRRLVSEEGGSIRVTRGQDRKTSIQLHWPFKQESQFEGHERASGQGDLLDAK